MGRFALMTRGIRDILLYSVSMALVILLLKWLELRYWVYSHSIEMLLGAVALIFTVLGFWVAAKMSRPKVETLVVEKEIYIEKKPGFVFDELAFKNTGLSERELEVLKEMASGLSNQEIADKLHLSLPTIKTHASNIFEKLDVKRRTQAIERAKSLNIIP